MKLIPLKVEVADVRMVSALWQAPPQPLTSLLLAHGAGAGMTHRSLTAIANGLADAGVATLRHQFPYVEKGGRRPDGPAVVHATVRAAIAEARRQGEGLALFAAGDRSAAG